MPWPTIEEVPQSLRKHRGATLTLEQANKWAAIYDGIKDNSNIKDPAAVAWTTWEEIYELKGGAWVKRSREASESMTLVEEIATVEAISDDSDGLPNRAKVVLIAAGPCRTKEREYTPAALKAAVAEGIFDNLQMYDAHPPDAEKVPGAIFTPRKVKELLSILVPGTVKFDESIVNPVTGRMMGGVVAEAELLDEDFRKSFKRKSRIIGPSLACLNERIFQAGKEIVTKIRRAVSGDWVPKPNAGGMVIEVVEAQDDSKIITIRIRVVEPNEFKKDAMENGATFSTITIPKAKGIKSAIGKLKSSGSTANQNFMFDGSQWTEEEAKKWVKDHGHKILRVDLTRDSAEAEGQLHESIRKEEESMPVLEKWEDLTADKLKENCPAIVEALKAEHSKEAEEAAQKAKDEAESKIKESEKEVETAKAEAEEAKTKLADKEKEMAESQEKVDKANNMVKLYEAVESRCDGLNILAKGKVMQSMKDKQFKDEKEMAEAIDAEIDGLKKQKSETSDKAASGDNNKPTLPSASREYAESIGMSSEEIDELAKVER